MSPKLGRPARISIWSSRWRKPNWFGTSACSRGPACERAAGTVRYRGARTHPSGDRRSDRAGARRRVARADRRRVSRFPYPEGLGWRGRTSRHERDAACRGRSAGGRTRRDAASQSRKSSMPRWHASIRCRAGSTISRPQARCPPQAGDDGRAMAERLRSFLPAAEHRQPGAAAQESAAGGGEGALPEWAARLIAADREAVASRLPERPWVATAISYEPIAGCFYNGDDPLQLMRQVPDLLAFDIEPREAFVAACGYRSLCLQFAPAGHFGRRP